METSAAPVRPGALLGIVGTAIAGGGVLGAVTNSINGAVSPDYFRAVLRWDHIENVWRAAIAQGIFEGVIYGTLFAIVFGLAIGITSRGRAPYGFGAKHLGLAGAIALAGWVIGGLLAMGLAALSPEFYRNAFIRVPEEHGAMMGYAWVGGSILGIVLSGFLALIIVAPLAAVRSRSI